MIDEVLHVAYVLGIAGDAGRYRHGPRALAPLGLEVFLLDHLAHLLGHRDGAVLVGIGQQQDELLAAEARDRIDLAQVAPQDLSDAFQDLVAFDVEVGIVVLLEVIDIEHHHGEFALEAHGALPFHLQHLLEVAPVEYAGELVGDR